MHTCLEKFKIFDFEGYSVKVTARVHSAPLCYACVTSQHVSTVTLLCATPEQLKL